MKIQAYMNHKDQHKPTQNKQTSADFDVFLCHNSRDKDVVRTLKHKLNSNKIRVWLDEDECQPGIHWQQMLEKGILCSACVAVLVGKNGVGRWMSEEIGGALNIAVENNRKVIPVLLPDAPMKPELPLFLKGRTWVDLRDGIDSINFKHLLWGITGRRTDLKRSRQTLNTSLLTNFSTDSNHLYGEPIPTGISSKSEFNTCNLAASQALKKGNGAIARSNLWRMRELLIRDKIGKSIRKVDENIKYSIFNVDSRNWARSAQEYNEYLVKFPSCLQVRLSKYIVAQLQAQNLVGNVNRVIDICCGTGLLAKTIDALRINIQVVGYDIPEMIKFAETEWDMKSQGNLSGHEFKNIIQLNQHANLFRGEKYNAAVMNMALFQFGLRERLALLLSLSKSLCDNALFWISTHAPDFEFPDAKLNRENPFKLELYRHWHKIGYNLAKDARDAITPLFHKDTIDSIRHLLNICGFDLLTTLNSLPIIESNRSIHERVAFSRMKAISTKVFGEVLSDSMWKHAIESMSNWVDTTYGTVLLANKICAPARYLFVEAPASPQRNEDIVYAASAVLRNDKNETLVVKRGQLGPLVRDYPNTWSLPSCMAQSNESLAITLKHSLKKHLGLDSLTLIPLAVRISHRQKNNILFVMTLFEGSLNKKARLFTKKYIDSQLCTPTQILRLPPGCHGLGSCLTCYQDVLRCVQRNLLL
jgi:hypothetical protein